jgi:hypothetical protein
MSNNSTPTSSSPPSKKRLRRKSKILTTIEHQGRCEKEQPKVGPKGERVGTNESKDTHPYPVNSEILLILSKTRK